jgi:hypothetical protein
MVCCHWQHATQWERSNMAVCKHTEICVGVIRVCRELGRHTYVTPTSYLELIYTYKELLGQQRAAVQQLRRRYEVREAFCDISLAAPVQRCSFIFPPSMSQMCLPAASPLLPL